MTRHCATDSILNRLFAPSFCFFRELNRYFPGQLAKSNSWPRPSMVEAPAPSVRPWLRPRHSQTTKRHIHVPAQHPLKVAVVGTGIAGAACAASLQQAGLDVTLYDKSRGVGGRLATRRATWTGSDGASMRVEFDHGAQLHRIPAAALRCHACTCRLRRRRRALARTRARALAGPCGARVLGADAGHAGAGAPSGAWRAATARTGGAAAAPHAPGMAAGAGRGRDHRPYDQIVLAVPPAQAAVLLAGHHDRWADALAACRWRPAGR